MCRRGASGYRGVLAVLAVVAYFGWHPGTPQTCRRAFVAGGSLTRSRQSQQHSTAARRSQSQALADLPSDARAWAEKHFVDEAKKLSESTFAFPPHELVIKAKTFLALNNGFAGTVGDMMADEFEFAGPVVGPLSKDKYIEGIAGFNFNDVFPDANFEMYDFRVDPFEPNRVWFTSRGTGTNTGSVDNPMFKKPTGRAYVNPPQACSIRFNTKGLVDQYTIGYVMDRRVGNTGGLGGIYGILYAVGKPFPFPEAQPHKPSLRYRLFNKLGDFLTAQKAKKEAQKAKKEAQMAKKEASP